LRLVEREAPRDSGTAVVTDERKTLVTELPHELELLTRHRPLPIPSTETRRGENPSNIAAAQLPENIVATMSSGSETVWRVWAS
jgi:hypothetical protein